ncbi:hypothetical protein DXA38_20920 [[Clostridium] innocuum]|uniref:Uncharacterized protein n=1 Tax=Clostridium innocuum TaxID=1522 RepID=A0A3E2VG46_CLOIN|nr:hypothetical protein DXA38_20920 [[Clostridium] innocuum]RHV58507.1 hypothetical protein DXB22_20720 [Clostridiaceae bacterium OM02-2AC]
MDSSFSTVWKRKEYRTEGLLRKQDKTPVVYDKKASLPIMLNLQKKRSSCKQVPTAPFTGKSFFNMYKLFIVLCCL